MDKKPTKKKASRKKKAAPSKEEKYFVMKGCSIVCLKGMIKEGDEISASDVAGGLMNIKKLIEKNKIEVR